MPRTLRYDGDEPQRVNKWLGQSGVCSRREAEGLIEQGLVSIDGETVTDAGRKILPGQTLTLADRAEAKLSSALTLMLHKPEGYVSGQPEPGKTPAVKLLTSANRVGAGETPGRGSRLAPVGRLDEDSRGLLILSEDGVVAKAVIGPESELEKEYLVRVRGEVTDRAIGLLRHGLELDGRKLKPARVTKVEPQRLHFVLKEGRNRQIRRMCDLVGLRVTDLVRVRVGPVKLGDLPEGKWRVLTAAERAELIAGKNA